MSTQAATERATLGWRTPAVIIISGCLIAMLSFGPRSAIGFLVHAAGIDGAALGPRRALTMPGVSATVGEQIAALREVDGDAVAARIRREPDATIAKIVAGWPRNFDPQRAIELGFRAEASFADIIRIHIEDELDGHWIK